jgi:hypothetical protein
MIMYDEKSKWHCESELQGQGHPSCANTFVCTTSQFYAVNRVCPVCLVKYYNATSEKLSKLYPVDTQVLEIYQGLFIGTEKLLPQTQKARGIRELQQTNDGRRITHHFGLEVPDYILIRDEAQFEQAITSQFFGCHHKPFARPCPKIPRHGFLDSKPVHTIDEARELFRQMRSIDPDSEIILMQRIDASHNAVITNTTAAIGLGHDGATSGKAAISLPVHGELRTYKDSVSITEEPYLEIVYDTSSSNNAKAVQLRNGPALPRTKDIIKETLIVDEIIDVEKFEPKGDLLAWEEFTQGIRRDQEAGKRKGLVIVHLNGPIGSHFCVHAVINNIPFITSHYPVIGEQLEASKPSEIDYREVKKGIEIGLSREFYEKLKPAFSKYGSDSHSNAYKGLVFTSLYALHGYPVAGREESKLIGLGIANLIRVSVCAALGEVRHHKGLVHLQGSSTRDHVYKKYFQHTLEGIKKLKVTEQIFLDGSWSDSYGGKNWASCTSATISLVNYAISFVKSPGEKAFRKLMEQFNRLINEVHNGGKFLNKFISNKHFDFAAQDLALFMAYNASHVYDFIKLVEPIKARDTSLAGCKQIRKLGKKDSIDLKAIIDAVDKAPDESCGDCGELTEDCSCNQ